MSEQVTEEITLHLGDEKTRTIRLTPEQEVVFIEWMEPDPPSRRTMMLDGIEYRSDEVESFSIVGST